jgi:hypothetical protein
MQSSEFFAQLKEIFDSISDSASGYSGLLAQVQQFLFDQFGQPGIYAAYVSVAAIGILFTWKMIKLSFAAMKYMVVPAVALAFVGTLVLPYSFTTLLPVTVTGCSVVLLFKA